MKVLSGSRCSTRCILIWACLLSFFRVVPSHSFVVVPHLRRTPEESSLVHPSSRRIVLQPPPQPTRRPGPTILWGHKVRSWEGDDLRWSKRIQRLMERRWGTMGETPVRTALILINIGAYLYQVINSLGYLIVKYPSHWPSWELCSDALLDPGATMGPLTRAFVFSARLGSQQPHRYVSSGFLHGSLLHLICNLYSLQQMPNWLETGLGWPLFLTTYIMGIVGGNYAHARYTMDDYTACLGASGGIVSLAGLAFMALAKMGNQRATSIILKNMTALFVLGILIPSVSNTAHIGGFLSGCMMGLLFSPGYRKSYSLRRKNSYIVDTVPKDFRQAMGFGLVPKERSPVPLAILWAGIVLLVSTDRRFQTMPTIVWKGLTRPGSLGRV